MTLPQIRAVARCKTRPVNEFYPQTADEYTEARRVCIMCPARKDCAEYAIAAKEPDGMWGGMTPAERTAEHRRRQRAARKAAAARGGR